MTTSWGRIALLYAIGVLAAGQLGIVPPLVPALQRDLGLPLAGAGMTVSIVAIVGIAEVRTPLQAARRLSIGVLRAAAPLSVALFCFALIFLALAGLLPAWLVDSRGLSAADAGRIVALTSACGILGSLFAGWLMRRGTSPGRLAALGLIATAMISALSFSATSVPLAVTGFALSFAVGGLLPAAVFASVPLVAADKRAIGPVNGLLAQTGSL